MGADYFFHVKSIATFAHTFFGYIISVLASESSVLLVHTFKHGDKELFGHPKIVA